MCSLNILSGSKWCSGSVICYQGAIHDGQDRRALNKYLQLSGTETWWWNRWKEISQISRGTEPPPTKGDCKFNSFFFWFYSKLWSKGIIQINYILFVTQNSILIKLIPGMINTGSPAKDKDRTVPVLTISGEVNLPYQVLLNMLKKNFLAIKKWQNHGLFWHLPCTC